MTKGKIYTAGLALLLLTASLVGQTGEAGHADIPLGDAAWIGDASDLPPPRCLRFACPFEGVGQALRMTVSADPRYVLLLDGHVIGMGPDSGDIRHWRTRKMTVDVTTGKHLLEAVVWHLGVVYKNGRTVDGISQDRPFAHLTWRMGFALKAEGVYDARLTTGKAVWRCAPLKGTRTIGTGANGEAFGVGPQFEVSGTSLLDETPVASEWFVPSVQQAGGLFDPRRVACGGVSPIGRRPVRTLLPPQLSRLTRPGETPKSFSVPAHSAVTNLFDLGDYYCAFPVLRTSGGRGARITWGWTEALRDPQLLREGRDYGKVNRAMRTGMVFSERHALVDVFLPDGRANARFTTPWWRCGRWCRLTVETGDEPLRIEDVVLDESRYPAEAEGRFVAEGDEALAPIVRMCERGLQNCMHEIMFDCPFYEQQMYGGDIRVSLLGAAVLTRDDRLTKQSLQILDEARNAEGYIPMNWPSVGDQSSTTWMLSWIVAIGDYALWHADRLWLKDRLAGVEHSLYGAARYENARGLLENAWGWNYLDWAADWKSDNCAPPGAAYGRGESAALNLLYAFAQQKAAVALEACGEIERAVYWRGRSKRLLETIRSVFGSSRGILADTPDGVRFSEHVQSLAILTGAVEGQSAERALRAVERGDGLTPCSSFFRHYLFEACAKMGRGDLILKKLDCWRRYAALDLKCPLESEFFPRSDCHAFGAHPLFHFHSALAGVTPAAPFFARVRVAPSPGSLRHIRAKTPHPQGFVETELEFSNDAVSGSIVTPVPGEFVWKGRIRPLCAGRNKIVLGAGVCEEVGNEDLMKHQTEGRISG